MSMLYRRIVSLQLFCVLAFTVSVSAQTAEISARHSLWKIQGKTNSLCILGSVHVLKDSDYPLPAVIDLAYTNAATLVFEADIGEMEDPAMALKLLSKGRLPEGETLEKQLSPEVYRQFTNHVSAAGIPPSMLVRFTPAVAAMTIAVMELQKLGLDPENGLDKHFFHRAREDSKQTVPLETLDFQMSLLTDLSKEEGELVMKTTLKDMDKMKSELGQLVNAWKIGDSAKLEKLLNEATEEAPAIYKRLVTDRNERWIPKIEDLLKADKSVLVIVGAGHLVGNQGVIELLRKKGWKITQL